MPKGDVISQEPSSGVSVAADSSVNLVVSSGPEMVAVPNVVGLAQDAAAAAITGAKLVVGTVTQQASGAVPKGDVISQEPSSGVSVAADSSVNLVVSSGPEMVTVPNVVGLAQDAATAAITGARLGVGTITQQTSGTVPLGDVISQNPAPATLVGQGSTVNLVISSLPPDPSAVAPPVDATVATTIGGSTTFLYSGENPIQTGVAPNTITPTRAAVVRGKVLDKNNAPLSGVTIMVLNHAELGQTMSRADGMFDLAVNGGGPLTLTYAKPGFFPAQRQLQVPWRDFALAPDVVLIQQDAQVTAVDLTSSGSIQVARGSAVTDSDGSRQATLFFPQGTQATMVMPDGSSRPLGKLNVRATEYTVGPNGPSAMPAELPPTSGYTYAVEFSADEAIDAGATSVTFSQPIILYAENFLNFPVGTPVPTGSYDRGKGLWIPSVNGLVLKILSVTGGMADLDLAGNGVPANAAALAGLGITDAERQQLASMYHSGQRLWRVPIAHFSSPWDSNWGFGPPPDAGGSNGGPLGGGAGGAGSAGGGSGGGGPLPNPCKKKGSVIECESQILGESVVLIGTPFRLHYTTDRVEGWRVEDTLRIALSGSSIPASLKRIDLEIDIAGRQITQSFPGAPDQTFTFTWDHNDAYGRTLQGAQLATIRIGFTYDGVYEKTDRFGYNGNGLQITGTNSGEKLPFGA